MKRKTFAALILLLSCTICLRAQIIRHTGYTLSYNPQTNNPDWVSWTLTPERITGSESRSDDFRGDPSLPPETRVEAADYKRSGYDRGHMCPAADNRWDPTAMSECFYMTNMCPQTPALNRRSWKRLEDACRQWVVREDSLLIVCGPIYSPLSAESQTQSDTTTTVTPRETIGQRIKITVPTAFFKVILSLKAGHQKAIGFYYTNTTDSQDLPEAARTVDQIESLTGLDFFTHLADPLEEELEKECDLTEWQQPK